jgi:hypothetical protein
MMMYIQSTCNDCYAMLIATIRQAPSLPSLSFLIRMIRLPAYPPSPMMKSRRKKESNGLVLTQSKPNAACNTDVESEETSDQAF